MHFVCILFSIKNLLPAFTGTHKIRKDCEHVQLRVFVRNLLILTV